MQLQSAAALAPWHELPHLPGGHNNVLHEVRERVIRALAVLVARGDGDVTEADLEPVDPVPDELSLEREQCCGQGSGDQ